VVATLNVNSGIFSDQIATDVHPGQPLVGTNTAVGREPVRLG
jgi:hypothetical protein